MKNPFFIILFGICLIFPFELAFGELDMDSLTQDDIEQGLEAALEKIDGPLVYGVEVYLLDVSNIDYVNGGYSFTFWITIYSDQVDFNETPPPIIDFVNGRIDSIDQSYVTEDGTYTEKVYGTFYTNMEYHNYPMMKLDLPIIIETSIFETERLKFELVPDIPSTVDEGLNISGFTFIDVTETIEDYDYGNEEVFSRFVATYEFETPWLSPFLIGVFPILVMMGMIVFLFGLNPLNHDKKIEVIIGVLIAGIFFHTLDSGVALPSLEYLTLKDKLMTVLYAMLSIIMVETVFQQKLNEEDELHKAKNLDKRFRYVFIGGSAVIGIIVSVL